MRFGLDVNVTVKLDAVHVHFHGSPDNADVLKAIDNLRKATTNMNAKLQAALDELIATTAADTDKLTSIENFVRGVPGLVGAAVSQALADADVDAATAAGLIHDASRTAGDKVDEVLAALPANTGGDTAPAGGGADTTSGGTDTTTDTVTGGASGDTLASGGGEDTVSGGDTLDAGSGVDTLDAGAGGDTVVAGSGADSVTELG